jgi:uncharacterized membrane protein (DUF106 family)
MIYILVLAVIVFIWFVYKVSPFEVKLDKEDIDDDLKFKGGHNNK